MTDLSELIEQLRGEEHTFYNARRNLNRQAAAALEQSLAEIQELREALIQASQLIASWSPSEYADKSYKDRTLATIDMALQAQGQPK